jgi:hypothetical protein
MLIKLGIILVLLLYMNSLYKTPQVQLIEG